MSYKIKSELERIYNNKKNLASAKRESRLQEVYSACPRVKEIDIAQRAIGLCKSYMIAGIRPTERVIASFTLQTQKYFDMNEQELANESEELKKEKLACLSKAGFEANYIENVYECSLCNDTGYIKEGVMSRRCGCYQKHMISILKKQSVMFNESQTFDRFSLDVYSDVPNPEKFGINESPREHMQRVVVAVKHFVENFTDKSENNMIFSGRTGTGKTFLANCVMSALLDKGREVLFMPANALFKPFAVYENEERDAMNDLREMIYNCDLLIIDDLGSEKMTSSRYSEFIDIINTRTAAGKKILITTNLSPKNIRDTYDERISSRLLGMYDIYKFTGDDIRLKTK